MNVSPIDLRQQRFRISFRGFDKIEVTSFLAAVADDYEHALRETDRVRQDLARTEAVLNEHREHEKNLLNTLTTAQKLSEEIKEHADQEACRIVRDAESRSDLLLEKTAARLEDIRHEIDGLKLQRKDVETSLEATIQTLRHSLEYIREREAHDGDEKILLHRPRHAAGQLADGDASTRLGSGRDAQERRRERIAETGELAENGNAAVNFQSLP